MNFKDLGKAILQKGLPILGTALGGPAGATVGALIANAFDADPKNPEDIIKKINLDPNAQIKLIEIQKAHEIELAKLALQSEIEVNKDRANARQREVELKDKIPGILAVIFTTCYLLMMYLFASNQSPETEAILFGINNAEMLILAYYFGSSASSKVKDIALINHK